jgi:hypothetical protein
VGGLYYTYALRGDGQEPLRPVPAGEQEEALDALMRTLEPAELTIPRDVLESLPPRPARYGPHRELFAKHTGMVFDAVAPATAAADATLQMLLHPERAARLVQQEALHGELPGLADVLARVREATFGADPADPYEAEVNRAVERVYMTRLTMLAGRAPMAQVRAVAQAELDALEAWLDEEQEGADAADRAHYRLLAADIDRFGDRPHEPLAIPEAPNMPPGSPIGQPGLDWLRSGWATEAVAPWAPAVDLSCAWR